MQHEVARCCHGCCQRPTNAETASPRKALTSGFVVARDGVEPSTFRFSVGRSYQLSYLAVRASAPTQIT